VNINNPNPGLQHLVRLVLVIALLCLAGALAGCKSETLTTVKVAVPVECRVAVPDRPSMPTESLQAAATLHAKAQAALAEIERREGYEVKLRAALTECVRPVAQPPAAPPFSSHGLSPPSDSKPAPHIPQDRQALGDFFACSAASRMISARSLTGWNSKMGALKNHSVVAIQAAIAKALEELCGEKMSVSIHELEFAEVGSSKLSLSVYPQFDKPFV
jgi:hypothetical protein